MADEYVLQTQGLTKEFRGFTAVKNVNLNVRRGTIHALIGPNGAGKTTCFNLITKFLPPTAGRILYKGRDITSASAHAVARLGLVRSFQISAVFPHLSVLENVRVALQRALGTSYHFWRSERSVEVLNGRAMELLDDVGVKAYARSAGRRAALWAQAGAGDRHHACARSGDAAAGRADGRHGRGRHQAHVGADQARGQGSHGADGGAQLVGGRRPVGPYHGAGARRGAGGRAICGSVEESPGDRSLHGDRRMAERSSRSATCTAGTARAMSCTA